MSAIEDKLNNIFSGSYGFDMSQLTEDVVRTLHEIPEKQALSVINEFEQILLSNSSRIEDPSMFLLSMLDFAQGDPTAYLSAEVKSRLQNLFDTGFCTPDEIDNHCIALLSEFPPKEAVAAIDELSNLDPSNLRNISDSFTALLKKHQLAPAAKVEDPLGIPPMQLPNELLYGFGEREYIPEMPRILDGSRLLPAIQDVLEHLIESGVVQAEDINERLLSKLRTIPPQAAATVAKEFASIGNATNVRSMSAYIFSVMKRTLERISKEPPQDNYYDRSYPTKLPLSPPQDFYSGRRHREEGLGPAGRKATRDMIDDVIAYHVSMGKILNEDINEDARKYLSTLDANVMRKVVEEFSKKDMGRIHNKTSFLVGIAKKTVL